MGYRAGMDVLAGISGEYIPDYNYFLVQLKDYSNAELMEKKDELFVVIMIDRLQGARDFAEARREVQPGDLQEVGAKAPEYLLDIIAQVAETMLSRLNVPEEEIEALTKPIKERCMGQLFAEFKGYDVQAARLIFYKNKERK